MRAPPKLFAQYDAAAPLLDDEDEVDALDDDAPLDAEFEPELDAPSE